MQKIKVKKKGQGSMQEEPAHYKPYEEYEKVCRHCPVSS